MRNGGAVWFGFLRAVGVPSPIALPVGFRRGILLGDMIFLIYVLAGISLWLTENRILWWCVLVSAVICFLEEFPSEKPRDEVEAAVAKGSFRKWLWCQMTRIRFEAAVASQKAKESVADRFWVQAPMWFAIATIFLSISGIVSSFF